MKTTIKEEKEEEAEDKSNNYDNMNNNNKQTHSTLLLRAGLGERSRRGQSHSDRKMAAVYHKRPHRLHTLTVVTLAFTATGHR